MRRRLLIVALFLLAGAVVNVAVAWGCGSRPNCIDVGGYDFLDYLIDIDQMDVEEVCEWWSRHAPPGFDSEANIVVIATVEFGISTFTVGVAGNFDEALRWETLEPYLTQQVFRLRSGLPARSMEGAVWFRQPHPEIYDAAIKLPFDDVASPSLLLRPVWPGFAVNTIFYAIVLWLLSGGPFRLRRWIRVRRGLCPKCAYPMGASDLCSECGKALPGRAEVAT